MKDKKYKNILTDKIILASKYAYDFSLDGYKNSEEGNKTAHPDKMSKKELIEMGIDLLKDDPDHEEI